MILVTDVSDCLIGLRLILEIINIRVVRENFFFGLLDLVDALHLIRVIV
jgi:hypothetical protein